MKRRQRLPNISFQRYKDRKANDRVRKLKLEFDVATIPRFYSRSCKTIPEIPRTSLARYLQNTPTSGGKTLGEILDAPETRETV